MKIKYTLMLSMVGLFFIGVGTGFGILLYVLSIPLSEIHGLALGFIAFGLAVIIKILSQLKRIEIEAVNDEVI